MEGVVGVVGGETVELGEDSSRAIHVCGKRLAVMPVVIRAGPLYGPVVEAFSRGFLSVPKRDRRADVLVELPVGVPMEKVSPSLVQIASTVVPTQQNYDRRNTHLIENSRVVIAFPGGEKTFTEIAKALDGGTDLVLLDGEGLALELIRRSDTYSSMAIIVQQPEEVLDYVCRSLEEGITAS